MVLHKLFCSFSETSVFVQQTVPLTVWPWLRATEQCSCKTEWSMFCRRVYYVREGMTNLANWLSVTWEQPRDPGDRVLLILWCPTESCHWESHNNTIQTALPRLPCPVLSWKLPIYLEMFSIYLEKKVPEQTRNPLLPQWILLSRLPCISAYTYRYVCLPRQHLALCKSAQSEILQENPSSQINSSTRYWFCSHIQFQFATPFCFVQELPGQEVGTQLEIESRHRNWRVWR